MFTIAFVFFFYFFCLVLFSLVSHPVYYCILLILNALFCSFIGYLVYGFSWYALLFCLIYIGGVYILFIFVSVHSPNSSVLSYWGFSYYFLGVLFWICFLGGLLVYYLSLNLDCSSYLCTLSEGSFYICMCLTLLFGFSILSIVMSINLNHYR